MSPPPTGCCGGSTGDVTVTSFHNGCEYATRPPSTQVPVTGPSFRRSCEVVPMTAGRTCVELTSVQTSECPGAGVNRVSGGSERNVEPDDDRQADSAHPARAELDTDPRPDRLARLGNRVVPGALAGAAHHDQVTVPQREPVRPAPPAADRAQRQCAGRANR